VSQPAIAFVTPTDEELEIDGVEARIWVGRTEGGTPFRLAVHRVFVDQGKTEKDLLAELTILRPRENPKALKVRKARGDA
jgi:hypothetical protein